MNKFKINEVVLFCGEKVEVVGVAYINRDGDTWYQLAADTKLFMTHENNIEKVSKPHDLISRKDYFEAEKEFSNSSNIACPECGYYFSSRGQCEQCRVRGIAFHASETIGG
jgi:hypothetical protein